MPAFLFYATKYQAGILATPNIACRKMLFLCNYRQRLHRGYFYFYSSIFYLKIFHSNN
jgi:hypothetical protein